MSKITGVQKILVQLFQTIRRGDTITWDLNLDIESELLKRRRMNYNQRFKNYKEECH